MRLLAGVVTIGADERSVPGGLAEIEGVLTEEARLVGRAIRDAGTAFRRRYVDATAALIAFDDEIDNRYLAVKQGATAASRSPSSHA
jgi:hypothetical protein